MKKRRVGDHKLVPLDYNPYEIRRRAIYAFLLCWERNPLLRNCLSRDVALKIVELIEVDIPEILEFGKEEKFIQRTILTSDMDFVPGWIRSHNSAIYYACRDCGLPVNFSPSIPDFGGIETTCKSNSSHFIFHKP